MAGTPSTRARCCPRIAIVANLQLKPGTTWSETYARCVAEAPEAFEPDRLLNLIRGESVGLGNEL